MAKKRNGLGSPPSVHAHKMRGELTRAGQNAEAAIRYAGRGQCDDAMEAYATAQYHSGAAQTHASSTSEKMYSGRSPHMRRVDTTGVLRKVIAARKAVTACIVESRQVKR